MQFEETNYRFLFEKNPQPIIIYDLNTLQILGTNDTFAEKYIYSKDELIGKTIQILYPDEIFPQIIQHISELSQDKVCITQSTHKLKNGQIIQVELHSKPLEFTEKKAAIEIITDITERKRQEDELKIAKIKAEEASLTKQQFLANMSHEIRTPMNAIQGMSRLLAKSPLSEKQSSYLEAIRVSADNLLVIINDILDMSKIESGKLTFESVGFDLQSLVRHLIKSIRYKAEEKGIGLFYEVDRRISKVLIGDPYRLNQILLNLVNNAIKFTDRGIVEIECNLLKSEEKEQTNAIEFKVIDTGKGISEDKLDAIFESFTQEDESIARNYGGTGLGLSISKQLVEMLGGTLNVQSKKSIGTTFGFTLVLKTGQVEDLVRKIEKEPVSQSLKGVKILLAEDHDINRFLATTILEEWGVQVEVVENGKEVLKRIEQKPFDLILMDIQMPLMSGLEATKIIRNQLKSEIPIIALTANALKGDSEKYLSAGMNGYVSKPFEVNELYTKITSLLPYDLVKNNHSNTSSDKEEEIEELFNLTRLKKMVDGSDEMVKKMVMMFLEKTPALLEELKKSWVQGDLALLSKIAHKLKPTLDVMSIDKLHNEIRMIETYAHQGINHPQMKNWIEKVTDICHQIFAQLEQKVS